MALKHPSGALKVFVHYKGQGVAGISVCADWTGGHPMQSTGPEGFAVFSHLLVGDYDVFVTDDRYLVPTKVRTTIRPGRTEELSLELAKGGTLRVLALDGDSAPVEGAIVRVLDAKRGVFSVLSGLTNLSGRYTTSGLSPGEYSLEICRDRFRRKRIEAVSILSSESQVDITAKLERGNSIAGRVLDSSGSPIAYARVAAYDGPGTNEASGECDQYGRFTVMGIGPGPVSLMAWASGYLHSQFTPPIPANSQGVEIRLMEEQQIIVLIECDPMPEAVGCEVSGTVIDLGGGFPVTDGKIKVNGLPPGEYHIEVNVPGYETLDRPTVTLPPGTATTTTRVRLRLA